jgi:hypothetical protein
MMSVGVMGTLTSCEGKKPPKSDRETMLVAQSSRTYYLYHSQFSCKMECAILFVVVVLLIFLLLPLGEYGIRETLLFTSVSLSTTVGKCPWMEDQAVARQLPSTDTE